MNTIQTNITVSEYGTFRANFPQGQILPGNYSLILTVHEQPPSDEPPQSQQKTVGLIRGEITPPFAQLLEDYMVRVGAGANTVAEGIKKIIAKQSVSHETARTSITRQTVNSWRGGKKEKIEPVMPHQHNCHLILPAIAQFLRLTEQETNLFLKAAGCAEVYLDLPETLFQDDIREIFDELFRRDSPVIMLLTQAGWGEPPLREALLAQARRRYLPDNVLHLQPPLSSSAYPKDCFLDLGKQCGFDNVDSESALGHALETRLQNSRKPLFLLLTRFEQYEESVQQQLGAMFNRLKESKVYHRLHVILCGGEALENLKYKDGVISFLNHAKDERWPELGREEVYALCDCRFQGLSLDDALVDDLLQVSGGHPQLLEECLKLKTEQPDLPLSAYPDKLSQCPQARGPFLPLAEDHKARQDVSELLQQQDLGKFSLPIQGYWHKKLYWKNLLVLREIKGQSHLCWRCDALRKAGQQVFLETENKPPRGEEYDS